MMISKSNHFRERGCAVPSRLDMANLADGGVRPFGFHNQSYELNDPPARFGHTGVSDALNRVT
jgi:hypothetical protein